MSTFDAIKKIRTAAPGAIVLEGDLLRRYQGELLKITEDIVSVFEAEGITWHLTGGSALGAVRHHGFIPWDDDVDIDILGSDFDRFSACLQKAFAGKYSIDTPSTPGYGIMTNCVRLNGTVSRGRDDIGREEAGFRVDISRIENTFDAPALRFLHGVACMGMGFLLSCRNFFERRTSFLSLAENNRGLRRVFRVKICIGALLSFLPLTKWAMLTQRCYSLCRNDRSKYVSVPGGRNHYFGEMYERSSFTESVKMEFEGHLWNIPREYDAYLSHMYGDYMRLPPVQDREKHVLFELKFPGEYRSDSIQKGQKQPS